MGLGSKIFFSVVLLIGLALLWMRYVLGPQRKPDPLSPATLSDPLAIVTDLWGALITWSVVVLAYLVLTRKGSRT